MNAEGIPGPKGKWSPTGVREILHRRDYKGEIITNRIQRAWDAEKQKEIRVEQPESEWKIRRDESLRVVSDELWDAAHARIAQTKGAYLKRGHQLVGQVESTKGLYLLSGMLACGVCHHPLIALKRGRNQTLAYVCRERRDRQACTNSTGVPMVELHEAVIAALRETFTEESFTRHLQQQANDVAAREQRAAERAHLLTEIPKYATTEQRLVKRIAMVEDDALKAEWADVKAQREQAERRLAELEVIERDLQADRAEVEQLRDVWKGWSTTRRSTGRLRARSWPRPTIRRARSFVKSWSAPSRSCRTSRTPGRGRSSVTAASRACSPAASTGGRRSWCTGSGTCAMWPAIATVTRAMPGRSRRRASPGSPSPAAQTLMTRGG